MSQGIVVAIFTTPESGEPMIPVDSVLAVENRGIIGDRYYTMSGHFSKSEIEPDQEITLVEHEAFKELNKNHQIQLQYAECRRNIITQNIDLNALVGQTFQVGQTTLRGMRLCEPCAYLSKMTGHSNLVKQWLHRAGLRAHIQKGGRISKGDTVVV